MKALKKFFVFLALSVTLIISFVFCAYALDAEGQCGENVTYTYDSTTKSVVISGEGDMWDYEQWENRSPFSFSNIESVIIEESVTSIGDFAFYWCTSLECVEISDSVTSIGDSAFYVCPNLESINIPDTVTSIGVEAFYNTAYYNNNANWTDDVLYIGKRLIKARNNIEKCDIKPDTVTIASEAFAGCSYIESIVIPDGVTSIGDAVFCNCYKLKTVTIPDSVVSIGDKAFENCYDLKDITIPAKATYIGKKAFAECRSIETVIIPNGITNIADEVFYGCSGLENITIPDSVTVIGNKAFYSCGVLKNITIPNSVTSIGESAFYYCELKSITIPDSVISIGENAFLGCDSLKSAFIGKGLASMGDSAFSGWDLESITVDEDNEYFSSDESGVLFNKDKTELIKYPRGITRSSYTIPNSVVTIGYKAFYNCNNIRSIVFPDSVTSIGEEAFSHCTNLKGTIIISDIVTNIGDKAFDGCMGISAITVDENNGYYSSDESGALFNKDKTVLIKYPGLGESETYTIPDSVTSLGEGAFSGCENLSEIVVTGSITEIGESEFSGCDYLESVIIKDGITALGYMAFSGCDSLKNMTIPVSVKSIGTYAFDDCESLKNIHYLGNEEQWKEISIEFGELDNGDKFLAACNINYNWCEEHINTTVIDERAPTCSEVGHKSGLFCDDCQNWISGNEVIYKTAHYDKNSDGFCDVCYETVSYEGNCGDNLIWKLYADGTLVISGEGEMSSSPWSAYKPDIKNICIDDGVTSLYNSAFSSCVNLESVLISDGITNIAGGAFYECTRLESVIMPDSLTSIGGSAFYGCTDLESITIPDTVTSIGGYAFYECKALENIEIPDSVTDIGTYAFYDCDKLESIIIPNKVTTLNDYAFSNCGRLETIIIPDSVTTIGKDVFSSNRLKTITIPKSVKSIHREFGCSNLESIIVDENNEYYSSDEYGVLYNKDKTQLIRYPAGNERENYTILDGVTKVNDYAFSGSGYLESVIIPGSVTTIGTKAFYSCYRLREVKLYSGLKKIDFGAFTECRRLETLSIPDSVTEIGSSAFHYCGEMINFTVDENNEHFSTDEYGALYNKNKTLLIRYPAGSENKEFIIPDSVTELGNNVFNDCENLENVIIPDSVTNIGSAFSSAYGIKSVTVGNGVTKLGENAFLYCSDLETVVLGSRVEIIHSTAFEGCNSLESITIPYSVKDIYGYAFYDCRVLADVYYAGSEAQWNEIEIERGNSYLTNARIHYNYVADHEHDYEAPVVIKEATCSEAGIRRYACRYCGSYATETIPVLEHTRVVSEAVDATCEKDGLTSGAYCSVCGTVISQQKKIDKLNHDYIYSSTVAATCTAKGAKNYTCSLCGKVKSEVIEKTDHILDSGTIIKEPTNTQTGLKIYKCKVCKVEVRTATLPKLEDVSDSTDKTELNKNQSSSTQNAENQNSAVQKSPKSSKPAKAKIKKPKSTKAKQVVVTWAKTKNANGYQVAYSTSKKFKKKLTKTKLIKKAKTTKTTLKKLKSGKKYFIKIRAYKTVRGKKTYGAYSKVMTVKVK